MGIFDITRVTNQADAQLEADIADEGATRYYDITERVADELRAAGVPISKPESRDRLTFCTLDGDRRESGFEMWVTLELKDGQGRPTGRRNLYIDWDDDVIDGIGGLATALGNPGTGTFKALGRLAKSVRRGIPGYEAYTTYLRAMAKAIAVEEPSATIDLKLPAG